MAKKKQLKAVDFFCCAGGVTHGFTKAGIKVLGGIDIEPAYKKTYEKNNKGSVFIQADISQLQPAELEKKLNIQKNMDDMVFVGCSPCQYYTLMKTDKTNSAKGKLLLDEFRRFVEYFNPGFIFIENVPGIETKEESPLSKFKEFLKEKKYSFDDKVLNASQFNVPQTRKRYVLIASRLNDKIKIPKIKRKELNTVRKAIGSYAAVSAGNTDKTALKHWTAGLENINVKRLTKTSHNGGTRLEWKDDQELQLKCYIGKDDIFKDVYGRMFWDLPAPTITTKFFSISNGRFGHPEQNRAISLREGATLQSFPKSYNFHGDSIEIIARMIGNAVPPKMAEGMGKIIYQNLL